MSDFRIVVEASPKGDWQRAADIRRAESRYYDGVMNCATCKKPLKWMLKSGHFTAECCDLGYRAAEAT